MENIEANIIRSFAEVRKDISELRNEVNELKDSLKVNKSTKGRKK